MVARIGDIDSTSREAEASPRRPMAVPHLILLGYGATDSLQITVESQRILARYGAAYSLGLPANLSAWLKSQRVKVTDLGPRVAPGVDYADGYLSVAHFLIERSASERPVIFLVPGNPLMFNAIGRYVAMEGQRLGLSVQAVPAVSPLDLIISGIGLDISTFGLQVFDATRLVARRMSMNPAVPAIVMHLGVFGTASVPANGVHADLQPLVVHLSGWYPGAHPATVVDLGAQGMKTASLPLNRLATASGIGLGTHLFLDMVRDPQLQEPGA